MSVPVARRRIRELAKDTANVVPGPEAPGRMRKRKITWTQIIMVLQKGEITEGPALDSKGGWRCTMERFAAGEDVKVSLDLWGHPRGYNHFLGGAVPCTTIPAAAFGTYGW
jgi:hypothetical protein